MIGVYKLVWNFEIRCLVYVGFNEMFDSFFDRIEKRVLASCICDQVEKQVMCCFKGLVKV